MRVYIKDQELINKINDIFILSNSRATVMRKIYSSEGIFYVINNTLKRAIINDLPCEKLTINNYEFIVDKSTIEYDSEWYQLNPNHISEIITKYEVGANEVGANEVGANEVGANEVGANEVGTIQLFIEKTHNSNDEMYFITNCEKNISTFLSELKLC